MHAVAFDVKQIPPKLGVCFQIVKETLCPMWDETLIFDEIVIYGLRDDLLQHPPMVTVEVFDYDLMVSISV